MPRPLDSRKILTLSGRATAYVVAYSGGLDSHTLLALLAEHRDQLPAPLRAVHVDHGLHPDSGQWSEHCQSVCEELNIPLQCERVAVEQGSSQEAQARDARYAAFVRALGPGEVLLTAHHCDDQAETLLLRMLRGAGTTGLSAIPLERPLGRGWLRRPLLSASRDSIHAWATARDLRWIEDPSNRHDVADRNYLRHCVMPVLASRWPGAAKRLAGTASDAAEASRLLHALAEVDVPEQAAWLDLNALRVLDDARKRNVMRYWLAQQGLPLPGRRRLASGVAMLVDAGVDRQPVLTWPGGRVRRYRQRLFADSGVDPEPPTWSWWRGENPLSFAAGTLHAVAAKSGLDPALINAPGLALHFGLSGVRCRPLGRRSRPLAQLFQEAGVPPWLRPVWPVLLAGDAVAAVPSICVCQGYQSPEGVSGLELGWTPWQRIT